MPKYIKAQTFTIADASATIAPTGVASGDVVEVKATDAGVWVNFLGGTASISGTDCIHIEQDGRRNIIMNGTGLTAIREAGTSAEVTSAIVAGPIV